MLPGPFPASTLRLLRALSQPWLAPYWGYMMRSLVTAGAQRMTKYEWYRHLRTARASVDVLIEVGLLRTVSAELSTVYEVNEVQLVAEILKLEGTPVGA